MDEFHARVEAARCKTCLDVGMSPVPGSCSSPTGKPLTVGAPIDITMEWCPDCNPGNMFGLKNPYVAAHE